MTETPGGIYLRHRSPLSGNSHRQKNRISLSLLPGGEREYLGTTPHPPTLSPLKETKKCPPADVRIYENGHFWGGKKSPLRPAPGRPLAAWRRRLASPGHSGRSVTTSTAASPEGPSLLPGTPQPVARSQIGAGGSVFRRRPGEGTAAMTMLRRRGLLHPLARFRSAKPPALASSLAPFRSTPPPRRHSLSASSRRRGVVE